MNTDAKKNWNWGLIAMLIFASPLEGFAKEIDLSAGFENAVLSYKKSTTSPHLARESTSDIPSGWDGYSSFEPITNQGRIDACQSFAMVAQMEYIIYSKTGLVIKLSEKYMAYSLLKNMTTLFWDDTSKSYSMLPRLGYGIAPFMVDTVLKTGVMPEQDYPWGDLTMDSSNQSIDVDLYNSTFRNPTASYNPAQYLDLLKQTFLSDPPQNFIYNFSYFNFADGKQETATFRTPSDFSKYLNLKNADFTLAYNKDFDPQIQRETAAELQADIVDFDQASKSVSVTNKILSSPDLLSQIVQSLDRRMVVGIAANVWADSWYTPTTDVQGGGHAIVIVGYQTTGGKTYFKIRNSWGKQKGVDGYNFIDADDLMPNLNYAIFYKASE